MADDWIKVRKNLTTHPKFVRIMSALKADKCPTLGGLVSAWCLLDTHSSDGALLNYTPEILDGIVGLPGLSRAMIEAGWLIQTPEGLQAPDFEKHNGATAKRRAQEARRKASARNADKCPQPMRTKCGPEKRREEKNTPLTPQGGNARAHAPARASVAQAGINDDWIESLKKNENYAHLNIENELAKCAAWCGVNGKALDRRRFVNWINGAHTPLTPPSKREHNSI